ncbi:urease accessory protein UreD [Ectothiorhodospiraceae bacterium BW-2]|nr:urease accessory protein UreD [Ectothiorhodospiraceae bacterium BW-2]
MKVAELSGWQAELMLGLRRFGDKTWLTERSQKGPLAIQRPFYPEGGRCHLYLLHPPGGVVGGDGLRVAMSAAPKTQTLITTPGATKFYRSASETAVVEHQLLLAEQSELEWLPQENIYFSGAQVRANSVIQLQRQSRLIYSELHCLGRPVNGERFEQGQLDLSLAIYQQQRPLLLERQLWRPQLRQQAGLRGLPVVGSLIIHRADALLREKIRQRIEAEPSCSTTLLDSLSVTRYLGEDSWQAQQIFRDIWQLARPLLLKTEPVLPRIWAT